MMAREIPSLRQLRAFEAVARLESISAAAREIHLSQPGVSQAIHALEERASGYSCSSVGGPDAMSPRSVRFCCHAYDVFWNIFVRH